jgi:multiple sugar transport system permease protein
VLLLFVSLAPFYWMIREAFTTNASIFSDFGAIPKNITGLNFLRVLGLATPAQIQAEAPNTTQTINVFSDLLHSVIFTAVVAIVSVFFCSMAAYAFARLRWRFRNQVFNIFLAALLMPPIFAILPNFITIRELGWIDTWQGLLAPYLLMNPFAIFFLRQFYLNVPNEIEEAAQLDGLSKWRIYWRIVLPISTAPLATIITIQSVFAWNEYLWPLLVSQTGKTQLLTSALGNFVRSSPTGASDWGGFMAAATVTVAPLIVFVLIFGKKLVSNLQLTSGGK